MTHVSCRSQKSCRPELHMHYFYYYAIIIIVSVPWPSRGNSSRCMRSREHSAWRGPGQASSWRPHPPQLPPPRPHPCGYLSTVAKKLPALDRRKRMEWASIGSDATDTHSLCLLHHSTLSLFNHARPFPVLLQREASTSTSRNEEDAFPWLTISKNPLRFGSEQRVWCHVKTICSDLTFFVLEANRECSSVTLKPSTV